MKARDAAFRAGAALLLTALSFAAAHATDPAGGKLSDAMLRQESIYRGGDEQVANGYTIDRSLVVYAQGLPSGFERALAALGPNDRWLDIGAGRGQAILDYVNPDSDVRQNGRERRGKAQAVAMSIEDRRTPEWYKTAATLGGKQIQYLLDRRLREYSKEEIGQFQLITDVIGGFSYTDTLSVFMETVLSLLATNGTFYTVLQDVQREEGASRPHYKDAPFTTVLKAADGSDMKVCAWLKRISCVEVTCESRADWQPQLEAYRVRKVCDNVSVPALALTHYAPGTPPERRFTLRD